MAEIKKIGVIGAGNMGSGIVQKIAQEGINVVMLDIKPEFVERGLDTIKTLLEEGIERKIFTREKVDQTLGRIKGTTDLKDVADADLVIEAVFEDKEVKSALFKQLDEICEPKTILATNTSGFYVRDFAKLTSRPDRFIGMHYFFHPAKNRLLEVISHEGTSQETVDKVLLAAKLHAKTAILVKDAPGFAVNRFFVPFYVEGIRMLEQGVANIPTIDAAAKKAFNIGMGPFLLMNVTGVPIALHTANTLSKELNPFYGPPEILKKQVEKKEDWDLTGDIDESKIDELVDRFYGVGLGVPAELVDDGVASIEDTDRGAKLGLRWSQGPFEIMNELGIDKTYELVAAVAERYPDFKVPGLLKRQKELGQPFSFNFVDLTKKGDIAYITINRPEAMNALNETVVNQLDARFDEAEADDNIKAIVFQGAGKAFVAGADIRYFVKNIENNNVQKTIDFTRKGHETYLKFENSKKFTVALLDGLSLGGGSELALACQAVVATPAGIMGFPETGIGIYPGLGGMLRFARQVGPELTKYYTFTGKFISAKDAFDLGIITKLVEPSQVTATIEALVKDGKKDKYAARELPERFQKLAALCTPDNVAKLLSGQVPDSEDTELAKKTLKTVSFKGPLALKAANEIIDKQASQTIPEGIETELASLKDNHSSADAYEGLSTSGVRRPVFQGK